MGCFWGAPFFWPQYFTNLDFPERAPISLPERYQNWRPRSCEVATIWPSVRNEASSISTELSTFHLDGFSHVAKWFWNKLTNVWLLNSEFTKKIEIQKNQEDSVINKNQSPIVSWHFERFLQSSFHPPQLFFFGRLVIGQNLLNNKTTNWPELIWFVRARKKTCCKIYTYKEILTYSFHPEKWDT